MRHKSICDYRACRDHEGALTALVWVSPELHSDHRRRADSLVPQWLHPFLFSTSELPYLFYVYI